MRVLVLLMVAAITTGCSSFTAFGAGPAFVVGDGWREDGALVEAATATGGSDETESDFMEARARVLATSEHQQVAGLAGASSYRRVTPHTSITFGADVGFGIEHGEATIFLDPIAQARVGLAFVLSSSDRTYDGGWNPRCPHWQRRRESTLLTMQLAGDADARFTRSPFFVTQLLVGVMFLEEAALPTHQLPMRVRPYDCWIRLEDHPARWYEHL